MIVASTTIKNYIAQRYKITARVTILLKDGTNLTLEGGQLMAGGVTINEGTSGSGSFDIGSAIINQCTILVNNTDGDYNSYNFEGAVATIYAGIAENKKGTSISWIRRGTYTLSDPTTTPAIITLKGVDYMAKFDRSYDGNMTFPRTLLNIAVYCCTKCGLTLGTSRFRNYDYRIEKNPFEGQQTYRQILSYCAQLACCYCKCDATGRLEFRWYGADAFDSGNESKRFEVSKFSQGPTVNTEDVVITGLKVTASDAPDGTDGESYLYGSEGYVLHISGNPLIAYGKASETAPLIGAGVVGMRFRPGSGSILGDPTMEAGDAAILTDRKSRKYNVYITNLTYSVGNFASFSCDAVPALRKSADRHSKLAATIAQLRKEVVRNVDAYVAAQASLDALALNALGFFETQEVQEDGSIIKYAHNAESLSESSVVYKQTADGFFLSRDGGQSYVNGFDSGGNAVLNMLAVIGIDASWVNTGTLTVGGPSGGGTVQITVIDENENVIGTWSNSGIYATNADITGVIKATSGKIGNWDIINNTIRREQHDGADILLKAPAAEDTEGSSVLAIAAPYKNNSVSWGDAPFRVTKAGKLYAADAVIEGKVTATSGSIGGWEITNNSIRNATKGSSENTLLGAGTKYPVSVGATWDSSESNPNWGGSVFHIEKTGHLTAKSANIMGSFTTSDDRQSIILQNGIIYGKQGSSQSGLIDMSAEYPDGAGGSRNIAIKGNYGLILQGSNNVTIEVPAQHERAWVTSSGLTAQELHALNGYTGHITFPISIDPNTGTLLEWIRLPVVDGIIKG